MRSGRKAVTVVLGVWVIWTLATWWFEGRITTFARPAAMLDRLIYTGLVNILAGTLGAACALRYLLQGKFLSQPPLGFGSPARTLVWVPAGLAAGLVLYFGQGAPSTDAIVIVNGFAQVLSVSIAEVMVCWALLAGVFASVIPGGRWARHPIAALIASLLFGVYHFAHSAPFNTLAMVSLLILIGLLTSAFFFISRDVYATIVFHNFLGVFGVIRAFAAQDKLSAFQVPQWPLIGTAAISLAVLVLADKLVIRRSA